MNAIHGMSACCKACRPSWTLCHTLSPSPPNTINMTLALAVTWVTSKGCLYYTNADFQRNWHTKRMQEMLQTLHASRVAVSASILPLNTSFCRLRNVPVAACRRDQGVVFKHVRCNPWRTTRGVRKTAPARHLSGLRQCTQATAPPRCAQRRLA